ncbi:RNA-binding motif protein, X-linked 2 [Geodia barretti]|uniref:RNA-binding motif protein, X-linked 2 n=1 Tax=Geodia barretti TaxID=519541 RepID=A0AA35XAQ1_GEOBA|nr:RNA-binding motif protein, X-linked 2 [Geodia barretti]
MTNTRTVLTSSLEVWTMGSRKVMSCQSFHSTLMPVGRLHTNNRGLETTWYGEIVNINLVRDRKSGQSKGFCFLAYEDQRSTVLAVDNLNGFKLCGRTLRVDHVHQYRRPKDEDGNEIIEKGCAPITPTPSPTPSPEPELSEPKAKKRKVKDKTKKGKKKEKKPKKKRHK